MYIQKQRTFSAIIIVLCLFVNAYAQQQPAENNANPSAAGQPAAASATTDSGQQTQPQPAPAQTPPATNNATPESNASPSAAGQPVVPSAPTAPGQQVQPQSAPVQPQYIVLQQPVPTSAKDSSNSSFNQIVLYTLLVIIIISIITSWFGQNKEAEFKIDNDADNPALNNSETDNERRYKCFGVLDGVRFKRPKSNSDLNSMSELEKKSYELSSKAEEEAVIQTRIFMNTLEKERITSSGSRVSREVLQRIANKVEDELINRICDKDSFWMKTIGKANAGSTEHLCDFVKELLMPIQVPDGNVVQLTPSPWRVGVLAVIGAVIGLITLKYPLAWCDFHDDALLAALIGTGVISSLVFWIASDKARRDKVIIGIGVSLALGWLCYGLLELPKKFFKQWVLGDAWYSKLIKWTRVDTRDNSDMFETLKKSTLGGFVAILLVAFMKFPEKFDEEEYKEKLKILYYERVQTIVMLLAAVIYNVDSLKNESDDEINERDNKIRSLQRRIDKYIHHEEIDINMFTCFKDFWNVDISKLKDKLDELSQFFVINGYEELPTTCASMLCMRQLKDLLETKESGDNEPVIKNNTGGGNDVISIDDSTKTGDNETSGGNDTSTSDEGNSGTSGTSPEPEPILVWSDDLESAYEISGSVYPGEEVEVLSEPVRRYGEIVQKGEVIRKRD